MGTGPWWTFDRIDNFGQIDPQGNYYKPDSNIMVPYGYAITALLPGTVTAITRTSWGQSVVTVKLDTPLNGEATHSFYEHMHDATVNVGDHLAQGTLLGHANLAGEGASLGFGLYSGDTYADGPGWAQLQKDLAPGGPGLLNPVKLLDAAKSGTLATSGGIYSTVGANTAGNPLDWSWLPGWLSGMAPAWAWLSSPVRVLKLVAGLLLVAGALFLLISPDAETAVKAAIAL